MENNFEYLLMERRHSLAEVPALHQRSNPVNAMCAQITAALLLALASSPFTACTTNPKHVVPKAADKMQAPTREQLLEQFLAEVTPAAYEAEIRRDEKAIRTKTEVSSKDIEEAKSLMLQIQAKYKRHPAVRVLKNELAGILTPEAVELRRRILVSQGMQNVDASGLQDFSLKILIHDLRTILEHGPDFTAQERSRREVVEAMFHYFEVLREQYRTQSKYISGKEGDEILAEMKRLLKESGALIQRLGERGCDPEKEKGCFEHCEAAIKAVVEKSVTHLQRGSFV